MEQRFNKENEGARHPASQKPDGHTGTGKCRCCARCDGNACVGEMPGMGGVSGSGNFKANYAAWENIATRLFPPSTETGTIDANAEPLPDIWLAPMTGAVENIGYHSERDFYFDMIAACHSADINIAVGDGIPDEKLLFGLHALAREKTKGAVFIKPYGNEKIFERIEASSAVAKIIGVDIDAYAIVTMRNLANLEKKTVAQLQEIQNKVHAAGMSFAVKGIFFPEEKELLENLRPDIAVVSNHGGRVETRSGSTAEFLADYGTVFAPLCGELWVDGGLRTNAHIRAAGRLGAAAVMIGRPFVSALLSGGADAVEKTAAQLKKRTDRAIV